MSLVVYIGRFSSIFFVAIRDTMPIRVQKQTHSRKSGIHKTTSRKLRRSSVHPFGKTLPPFGQVTEQVLRRHFERMVFSPVWGIVDYINTQTTQYEIGIYLRGYNDLTYDPHSIFAPVGGKIHTMSYASTEFMRVLKHKMLIDGSIRSKRSPKRHTHYNKEVAYPRGTLLLKTREKKNGILTVKIGRITFMVEVGHRYITKSLALYQKSKDIVFAGQHIGDILIGSYCVLHIPCQCKLFIREGDNVKGGVNSNPLACLSA